MVLAFLLQGDVQPCRTLASNKSRSIKMPSWLVSCAGHFRLGRSYMRIRKLCFLTAVALMIPSLAIAQGVASGDLHVIVTDPQGQAVIGAKVVAVDQAKGLEHEASANGLGGYEFVGL